MANCHVLKSATIYFIKTLTKNESIKKYRQRLRALIPQRHLLCYLCGELILSQNEFSLDHVIPKSKGGATEPWNLYPAHKTCNEAKAAVLLKQHREKQK